MKVWERAAVRVRCGRCGDMVARGEPVLVVTVLTVKRELYRCATCAGEPVPELAPLREFTRLADVFAAVPKPAGTVLSFRR